MSRRSITLVYSEKIRKGIRLKAQVDDRTLLIVGTKTEEIGAAHPLQNKFTRRPYFASKAL